jgi:endonuclease/exonuclease/phosphatase family metal-dependent hydrolase
MKNHLRWPLLGLSAAAALCLVFLASCQTASPPAPPPLSSPVGSLRAPAPEAFTETADLRRASLATLRIASFNIANLSAKNLAKSGVGPELALIFRRYDLIAVQEVTGASTDSVDALLTFINQGPGPEYRFLVSPYSGTMATAGQKEKYAFFYNSSTVTPLSAGVLYPDPLNVFVREPFAAQFRANGSPESFVLLNFHAEADKQGVSREIPALGPASAWAADYFTGELGVIILGDFNAGVTYISPAELAPLRAAALPFLWIVPDSADTTFEDGFEFRGPNIFSENFVPYPRSRGAVLLKVVSNSATMRRSSAKSGTSPKNIGPSISW